eukprot:6206939-Pleurochrysis_carterae.AAC.4
MAMATVGGRHPEVCEGEAAQREWAKARSARSSDVQSTTEAWRRMLPAATVEHAATVWLGETSGKAGGAVRGASACAVDAAAAGREAGAGSYVCKLRVAWSIGGTDVETGQDDA